MVIELGGGIELAGFEDLEGAELVVVKKLVGRYARKLSDNNERYEKLVLEMEQSKDSYSLEAEVVVDGESTSAKEKNDNLFIGMDAVLKKLIDEAS